MSFQRRIVHCSPGPADVQAIVSDRAVAGCWFELHRRGGCGAGELQLKDNFPDRHPIDIGDWIALEYNENDRWYLGRVESREARSPAGVTFRLEGMSAELNEVFPGGFSRDGDGVPPHRFARTDLFVNDPDHALETFDTASEPAQLVEKLLLKYVVPRTNITYNPALVEPATDPGLVHSYKFRGEESMRSILKELALRSRNAGWGVNERGEAFFLNAKTNLLATWREGRDTIRLEEERNRDLIYNRVLLTGGYVYGEPVNSEITARGFYRWRGNYVQPASRDTHGERRIRLWIPWIRSRTDSREFVREFFRLYAQPTTRYTVEVAGSTTLVRPWQGSVKLEDRDGNELITAPVETIRVQFDHTPVFQLTLGPDDPRTHWPEPAQDERWELPADPLPNHGGELITYLPHPVGTSSSFYATSSNYSSLTHSNSETASTNPPQNTSSINDTSLPETSSIDDILLSNEPTDLLSLPDVSLPDVSLPDLTFPDIDPTSFTSDQDLTNPLTLTSLDLPDSSNLDLSGSLSLTSETDVSDGSSA